MSVEIIVFKQLIMMQGHRQHILHCCINTEGSLRKVDQVVSKGNNSLNRNAGLRKVDLVVSKGSNSLNS